MSQNYIDADTLREMRRIARQPLTLVYHSHDNNFSPGVLSPRDFSHALVEYDHVFTTKSQNVARYQSLGQANAHYLPSAFEPSVHQPIRGKESRYTEKPFEVTFVGTFDSSREPLVEAIGWDRLNVWGNHWKNYSRYDSYYERITTRAVYHHHYADIVSNSQVALGLLRQEAEDLHTQRTFEIPACGALQVAPRNQEITLYFKENKEIINYF
jgi:spore maturation protein CgeB